jgi:ELWxxDGT repeat protein
MRSFSFFAGILLAFCFISQAWSQSSSSEKSYSALSSITVAENFFFFTLNDDEHGLELWRSDGSTPGTILVKDIRPDYFSSAPSNFRIANNILFFTADDGIHGRELWRSDGSTEGTYMVADLSRGEQSSAINMLDVIGNEVKFQMEDEDNGLVTWKSDGTFAGTGVVEEFENGGSDDISLVTLLSRNFKKQLRNSHLMMATNDEEDEVVVDGRTLFVAADARRGEELWCFNDREVSLVKDIHPGIGESFITDLTVVDNLVYFSAYDGLHGSELWKSDGTPDGTEMVADILPGTDSSLPRSFTGFQDKIYFSVVGEHGVELWVTDGTRDGTKEIFPATSSSATNVAAIENTPSLENLNGDSFNEDGTTSRIHVFPNPFTSMFHIWVESPFNENIALSLMDVSSRTMYDVQEKTNADIQIDTPLTQGTYFVRIRTRKNFETVRVTKAD